MECNKEEAVRAKEIAEKKMRDNDFEGAQKMALRAKNLYPDLENIIQMLSICDVHCSAQKRLPGSEKDWYGVLQVEKFADEATIKKQYRRLALILHPDKNRFPGAEGAFKLICEANALLSDPIKKSVYDNKVKVMTRPAQSNPPNHYQNRSSQLNKQYSAQDIHASSCLSRENKHQVPHSASVFWTCCPFCSARYQYHRQYINRSLHCQRCRKLFVTYEVSARGVTSGSMFGYQGASFVPSKPDVCQPSTSNVGSQETPSRKTAQPHDQKGYGSESMASTLYGEKFGVASNGDATRRESGNTKGKSQKRGKKSVRQCSDSSDTDIGDLTDNLGDATTDLESEFIRAQFSRRSSRRKKNVSYKETDEDDYSSPLKRARTTKEANGNEQKAADSMHDSKSSFPTAQGPSKFGIKEMGAAHSQESMKDKNEGFDKEGEMRGVTGGNSSAADDAVKIESDSYQDLSSSKNSDIRSYDCPDPEFSDFDKLRDESHFRVNQFWACYDDRYDGMPRFYAKVIKIFASPFELQIKWLEAVPVSDAYNSWVDEELPVGCGSFKLVGRAEKVSGIMSFSHQVQCEVGKKKGFHFMYPREGEVWAIFKDWDISWSSNLEDHKNFRYEVVEVLSNFAAGVGIEVCYLNKVTGFVSLFERASDTNSFIIEPSKLYKFSHYVPCFKLTGSERGGVPIGSFELDPAALPLNPDDLYFPCKAKTRNVNMDPLDSRSSLPEGKVESVVSGGTCTPHKIVDSEVSRAEASILRRSPRGVNAARQDSK